MKYLIALFCTTLLSGCASTWNLGSSDFSCPGMPKGVICKTPHEVYKLTNNKSSLVTLTADGQKALTQEAAVPANAVMQQVHLPQPLQQPMPVMEAAQVMRIWVAPWIDQAGDLHYPSYIYSEITPRRWSFGNLTKGQGARIPVAAYVDGQREEQAAGGDKVLPMAPAGIAPVSEKRNDGQTKNDLKKAGPMNGLFKQ